MTRYAATSVTKWKSGKNMDKYLKQFESASISLHAPGSLISNKLQDVPHLRTSHTPERLSLKNISHSTRPLVSEHGLTAKMTSVIVLCAKVGIFCYSHTNVLISGHQSSRWLTNAIWLLMSCCVNFITRWSCQAGRGKPEWLSLWEKQNGAFTPDFWRPNYCVVCGRPCQWIPRIW